MTSNTKRASKSTPTNGPNKRRKQNLKESSFSEADLEGFTQAIEDSCLNYNRIVDVLKHSRRPDELGLRCCSALCTVFCNLIAANSLTSHANRYRSEDQTAIWLLERFNEFIAVLLHNVTSTGSSNSQASLGLLLELLKAQVDQSAVGSSCLEFEDGILQRLIIHCLQDEEGTAMKNVVESYVLKYSDLRQHFLGSLAHNEQLSGDDRDSTKIDRLINTLATISTSYKLNHTEDSEYLFESSTSKSATNKNFRAVISRAWLSLLKQKLDKQQTRTVLELVPLHIAPLMPRPELLLDFLTDCCDRGGTEGLLALSGLRNLVAQHKLDYPALYSKLYAAVGSNVLHNKRRSHTLRLIDSFLSSTHLPATLVASFLKRLARLCLFAPPAAIVAVMPFVYNIIKSHPVCSLMLQRKLTRTSPKSADAITEDPFDANETDPTLTGALESSLWELDTLSSHWHPNVATISRMIAEQFLKQSYNMEHFLDHTYQSLLVNETKKAISKPPAVEHHLEKTIFNHSGVHATRNLNHLWTFHDGMKTQA